MDDSASRTSHQRAMNAVARRHAAQRIERFLDRLHREARDPSPWETSFIEHALLLFEAGSYIFVEDAMRQAENPVTRGLPAVITTLLTHSNVMPTAVLRARLRRIAAFKVVPN